MSGRLPGRKNNAGTDVGEAAGISTGRTQHGEALALRLGPRVPVSVQTIEAIEFELNIDIDPDRSIIFFDEVQGEFPIVGRGVAYLH